MKGLCKCGYTGDTCARIREDRCKFPQSKGPAHKKPKELARTLKNTRQSDISEVSGDTQSP